MYWKYEYHRRVSANYKVLLSHLLRILITDNAPRHPTDRRIHHNETVMRSSIAGVVDVKTLEVENSRVG